MKKQIHAYYGGNVQGVGFRFTAEFIARDLNVTGWAKNLPDGRVELLGEGEEPTLKDFLRRIDSGLGHNILHRDIEWKKYTGEFKEFNILFY